MSDEALRQLLAEQNAIPVTPQLLGALIENQKEAPVGKFNGIKKWLVIHPKVKTGAIVAAGIAFVAFDNAYNGGESYRQAAHEAGGGVLVVIGAYLGKNKLPV